MWRCLGLLSTTRSSQWLLFLMMVKNVILGRALASTITLLDWRRFWINMSTVVGYVKRKFNGGGALVPISACKLASIVSVRHSFLVLMITFGLRWDRWHIPSSILIPGKSGWPNVRTIGCYMVYPYVCVLDEKSSTKLSVAPRRTANTKSPCV